MSVRFPFRNAFAEIARAQHIAEVLLRNGLGFIVQASGLTRFLPPWRARRLRTDEHAAQQTIPQRIRQTLEELGPTFIKLGQILSTRPDILPPEYILELSKLLDAAPPVPLEEIRNTLQTEFGEPLESLFLSFEPEPIASASIGQVHRAVLHDGTAVIVKVQRPGIRRIIEADLHLLLTQARFLETHSEALANYGLTEIVQEFAESLRAELDYTQEGRNAERLRELPYEAPVVIPKIYWAYTTQRVITMQDLQGIKLSEIARLQKEYDLSEIADHIVHIYLEQIFIHGIFHADPHPANILVCEDRIGLVDFGTVGFLTPTMREHLGNLLFALTQQDVDEMVRTITQLGAITHLSDIRAVERDLQRLLVRYYNVSLESVPLAQFLADLMSISFRHHIRLPSDLALLARTIVVLEGLVRNLAPSLQLIKYLNPFIIRLMRERFSLQKAAIDSLKTLRDLQQMLHVMPRRIDLLTEQLEQGEMTIGIDVRRINQALQRIEAMGNRISFSVVVAALIIGSALILLGGESAAIFRVPFTNWGLPVAKIGFLAAGLLGAWWLFSIIRSRSL